MTSSDPGSMNYSTRLRYFLWAARESKYRNHSCPGCESSSTHQVRRKMLVTALWECRTCRLRFRVPKESPDSAAEFYQREYEAGFGTDLPSDRALEALLDRGFKGGEKDYQPYIDVLGAVGLRPGQSILDFGCSWGYGSWQFRQAGFRVQSYEVSRIRSDFARRKLGCTIVEDVLKSGPADCLFSAHVLEHLPDPNALFRIAETVLAPKGVVVCFLPNGEPTLERIYGSKRYHQLWGKVHPLLIGIDAALILARRHHYVASVYTSPYDLRAIETNSSSGHTSGGELLLIARKFPQ